MIITEVYVPSIDKSYEFKMNEDVSACIVMDEIVSVICQKEQCAVKGDKSQLMLLKLRDSQVISLNLTLYENGVESGDRLILV